MRYTNHERLQARRAIRYSEWGNRSGQKFALTFAQAAFEGVEAKRACAEYPERGIANDAAIILIYEEPFDGYDLIVQIERNDRRPLCYYPRNCLSKAEMLMAEMRFDQ